MTLHTGFARPALLVGALLALTACKTDMVTEPVTDTTPGQAADACNAAPLQSLVGQPASTLDTMRFASPMRVIRPDTAVTMDFNESRLNIAVDEAETISRVYCG